MKRAKLLIFMLLALVGATSAWAIEKVNVNPYTVDFNTTITTSIHDFKVASNWKHIVDTYEDYWGDESYPSYTYSATGGVDGSGALYCITNQESNTLYDLLVTPTVNGTVTIAAKSYASYYTPQLSFYKIVEDESGKLTRGDQIEVDITAVNSSDYVTITILENAASERIGIRSSYVYLDNFAATSADIEPEVSLKVSAVMNSAGQTGYTGTNPTFKQQADGTLLVQLQVTLQNTGDVDLVAGTTENYTLTLASASSTTGTKTYYEDTPFTITENIAAGESKTIDVELAVNYTDTYAAYRYWFVRENVTSTTSESYRYATSVAYEPKFIFREAGSTATSSISNAQGWGTITESTTKAFEIANTGTAPLTIKSITLPEGFTSDNTPTSEFTLATGETQALNITQDASVKGTFAGTLSIVYLNASNEETTYTLDFSATVIGANTWTADFNNSTSTAIYPQGSVKEGGISTDWDNKTSDGKYNIYLKGVANQASYQAENNKFITPKLHANAGDKLAFDVKAGYSSSDDYFVKVYVSADRQNWGEPVETYVYSTVGSSFTTKTVNFATEGDYYVAFAIYGTGSGIDNLVGLEKVDVAHDLYIKSVNWPDASIKSGTAQSKPSVDVIPLTDEAADNYTVKYIYGENEVVIASKALTASASSTTSFAASFTPEVESTTTFPGTKVVFEFTDGTKFETETFDLTVTNEPIFHFVKTLPSSKWYEPSDYTTPIAFGKTNVADTQNFYINNWGSAPLTVKSIVLPTGFSTSVEAPLTVAAYNGENDGIAAASQALDITFSATEAGSYSGDMVITYVDGTGADATFTLAVSGTKLDPAKFYVNFGAESNQWPAGSVYQSNVSTTYVSTGNYAITSSSTSNNIFVTPKLTATDGEKLMFDAKLYNSSWSEGKVVVYAAATRDEVLNAEEGTTRVQLFSVSGQDAEGAMTTDFQTFEVTVPEAGDYYFGFEISNRPYVDEIYGLIQTAVAHDWQIASSNIPAEAMQNVAATATVNVLNFGVADEAADAYTATLYVNGEAIATAEGVAIPMNHKLNDAGTQLSFSFRYPKVGTFPVYIEVKAGDYSVATDPVDVAFAGEVATAEGKQVGTQTSTGRDYGFVNWYDNDGSSTRYTDILYPAAKIEAAGIKAGDKITAISFKASNSAKTFKAEVTSWVGTSTGDITYGTPDKDDMQEVTVYTGSVEFPANVESVITLAEPIVWDGTSDIRVYTEAVGQGSGNWMSATYAYDSEITMSYNGTTKAAPLAYFTLAAESAVISGTVKNAADEAIEGATITLVSRDGDNIQYAGTTDSEGAYSINVIQSSRDYNVFVNADGYVTSKAVAVFTDGDFNKNFTMVESPLNNWTNTNLASTEGWTWDHSTQYSQAGNGLIGTWKAHNDFAVATVDDSHLSTEYAFGFECRWSTNYTAYTQESAKNLPAGKYTLTFDVENVNSATTSATYNNLFKVTVGETVYADASTEWMKGKSSWTEHSIEFTVTESAKATLSFGYGTGSNNYATANTPVLYVSHLAMTFVSAAELAIDALDAEIAKAEGYKDGRTEALADYNAAIATAKGFLTSEDVDAINSAIAALQTAETAFLTANLPVDEGTYYVYNPMTQKFLSRGNAYGTAAVVDDYGVAINVAVVDLPNAAYTLSSFDNGANYGFDAWMYADAGGNNVRSYTFTAVEGGYTVTNTNNNMLMYVYTKEDGNKFRVAGNAIKGDNYTDDAQTVWQFVTPADRDAMVADREAAAEAAAFASAGIDEGAMLAEAEATEVSFTSGNAWTQTVVRTQDNQPATNANGTEMWQATGNYTQTIADLPSGLYNVSIQAFYRNGNADEDQARVATGYNTVLAYLEANGNKVQVKSWSSDKGDGNDPNTMAEAKDKFDEDKYLSEVYTFVGEDGKLNLTVNNPAHIGNGWFIVGNVKYAKVEELVELTDEDTGVEMKSHVTVAVERNFKAGWNAVILPFAITAEEIKAQFGENTEVAACDGYELSNDDKDVTVKFKKVDAMEINTPYLLWLENAISATEAPLFFYTKEVYGDYYKSENTYFNVIGVYQPTVVNAGDLFMQGGKFVKATENNTVLPYRFYLEVAEGAELTVKVDGDLLTGINGIFADEAGQSIYNLSGQRVQKAQKGIYIVNGKKALVK